MIFDPVMYRRYLSEARGRFSSDVYASVAQYLLDAIPAADRLRERDGLLREAAALVADPRPWTKARRIHEELTTLRRGVLPSHPEPVTIRGILVSVLAMSRRPPSRHLIYRAITCKQGVVLQVAAPVKKRNDDRNDDPGGFF